jgi:hypothetical protein
VCSPLVLCITVSTVKLWPRNVASRQKYHARGTADPATCRKLIVYSLPHCAPSCNIVSPYSQLFSSPRASSKDVVGSALLTIK